MITEIEQGALDDRVPLAATLRKCMILGGQARSAELRTWACRELSGYAPNDELPEWRKTHAPLQIDGFKGRWQFTGQQVSSYFLPDFAREDLTDEVLWFQGVGELESMIRNADDRVVRLMPPMGAELVAFINAKNNVPYQHVERLYWAVSITAIEGMLDRIRSALTELVAELRAGMPEDAELPSEALATQAVQVAVHGENNRVTVTAPQASGAASTVTLAPEPAEETETVEQRRWTRIATWVGVAAAVAAVVIGAIQVWG